MIYCPIKLDESNQLTFNNATDQYNYFTSLPYLVEPELTYQRKDGVIRFRTGENNVQFEDLLQYNYVMYQNTTYDSKWFYAYVTDIKYVNDGMSEMTIETDVFQTWQFEIQYMNSFIEREHVSDDTVGAHTIPEGLETGEYTTYLHYVDNVSGLADSVILATTVDPFNSTDTTHIVHYCDVYNGLISGCGYYKWSKNEINALLSRIDHLAELGQSDSIVSLFMYPSDWAPYYDETVDTRVAPSINPITFDYGITRIETLDGYAPLNKKLLTYPYCYIMASNGIGTATIYKQELWDLDPDTTSSTYNKMVVRRWAVLCPGGSARVSPLNYNGCAINVDEGFSLGKFPQLSWPVDLYTNWEVQNGINIFGNTLTATESGLLGSALQTLVGSATGDAGNIAGGLRGIFGTMQEQYRHQLIPPAVGGNINSGDVSAINGLMAFQYQKVGIKSEFAQSIDNYFEMFGYKLCTVATPNITSRSNWNYIKTIDVNMTGDIPERDLQELKDLYNGGFTIWHNPAHYLDYSQTNN